MNYYEHHIGDYDSATAHLSLLEDGAYRRLISLYYRTEAPLPADVKGVCRLVRAVSKPERDAVAQVLQEFFVLEGDGWHNDRCDEEIGRYCDSAPDREAKKANERDRQRRTRERRKQLFDLLREHGVVPAYDAPMSELQALASRIESQPVTRDKSHPVTRDATATHPPLPNPQTPEGIPGTPPPPAQPAAAGEGVTDAGAVCIAVKQAGIGKVNPGDVRLTALLARGAKVEHFVGAVPQTDGKRDPWAYLLAVVESQMAKAAEIAARPLAAPAPQQKPYESAYARGERERYERMGLSVAAPAPGAQAAAEFFEMEATDVTPRRLG